VLVVREEQHLSFLSQFAKPNFPNSAKKVSNINIGIAKVSTTRRWLGGERSFLAR
jgi:hypothetical protein